MALIVEDGTGLADAQSYAAAADADTYFTERNETAWTAALLADKEIALIKASEYADVKWGAKLRGLPLTQTQSLAFPRSVFVDRKLRTVSGVPTDWVRAVYEYALLVINSIDLYPTQEVVDQKKVASESVTIGPITTSKTYDNTVGTNSLNYFAKADALAKTFTKGGGASFTTAIRN